MREKLETTSVHFMETELDTTRANLQGLQVFFYKCDFSQMTHDRAESYSFYS